MRLVDADLAPIYLNEKACEQIKSMPTIDPVPVVRCKDCVYKASAEVIDGFLICPASGMEICDDDFCSYGKRKEKKHE